MQKLKEVPVIQYACDELNISRNTFYRWRKSDAKFRKAAEEAMTEGEAYINDMTETQLISLIQKGEWRALSLWIHTRNPKFRTKIDINADVQNINLEYSPEEREQLEQAIIKLNQK